MADGTEHFRVGPGSSCLLLDPPAFSTASAHFAGNCLVQAGLVFVVGVGLAGRAPEQTHVAFFDCKGAGHAAQQPLVEDQAGGSAARVGRSVGCQIVDDSWTPGVDDFLQGTAGQSFREARGQPDLFVAGVGVVGNHAVAVFDECDAEPVGGADCGGLVEDEVDHVS